MTWLYQYTFHYPQLSSLHLVLKLPFHELKAACIKLWFGHCFIQKAWPSCDGVAYLCTAIAHRPSEGCFILNNAPQSHSVLLSASSVVGREVWQDSVGGQLWLQSSVSAQARFHGNNKVHSKVMKQPIIAQGWPCRSRQGCFWGAALPEPVSIHFYERALLGDVGIGSTETPGFSYSDKVNLTAHPGIPQCKNKYKTNE